MITYLLNYSWLRHKATAGVASRASSRGGDWMAHTQLINVRWSGFRFWCRESRSRNL